MTHKTFAVTDPRNFDGDPFDVADKAVAQLSGVLTVAGNLLPATVLMARNAEMERNLLAGDKPRAGEWDDSPQGTRWETVSEQLDSLIRMTQMLQRAAGFDPRKRD